MKAGTTSLFEYLRTHPDLYLPPAKEQPFFTVDRVFLRGWDEYARYAFSGAPSGRLWGKVSPQYLGGPVVWNADTMRLARKDPELVTPRRIAAFVPDGKFIVLLRDPVERAISHYWLAVTMGQEKRPLVDAMLDSLDPSALRDSRISPKVSTCYVTAGEYGRLLAAYLDVFPRSQFFVASTHALARDPLSVLRALWQFLGVDTDHVPPNLYVRYRTRASGRRFRRVDPRVLPRIVRRTPLLREIWDGLPVGLRDRVRSRYRAAKYRLDLWNRTIGSEGVEPPDAELLRVLAAHYRDDLAQLEELVGSLEGVTPAAEGAEPANA